MSRLPVLRAQLAVVLEHKVSFKVIYHTHGATVSPDTRRLCILDSSFNPPHYGHYSLIKESVKYRYNGKDPDTTGVLLMFSVNNCDKKTPKPAAFEYRLDMMCLFADYIKDKLDVPTYVIITDQAIFADKSLLVQSWIKDTVGVIEGLKLTFLLGYDTLVRVFDNKYYEPIPTTVALRDFMEQNDLFSVTRDDDKNSSIAEQLQYVDKIKAGKIEDCLSEWGDKIFVTSGDAEVLKLSSSKIRSQVEAGDDSWHEETIPTLVKYLQENKVY